MSDCIGEGCTHPSHNHDVINAQRAIPATETEVEKRIYRGEECPVVKFNSGPFKNRIYVRFRGSLVHVGNRKMIAVKKD